MAHRIASYVHVAGFLLVPGDVPPPDLADQVSNPKAWASGGQLAPERPAPRRVGQVPDEDQGEDPKDPKDPEDDVTEDSPKDPAPVVEGEDPPRPAKSAKVEAWREYILAVADVTEDGLADLTKDQLVEMADQLDD